MNNHTVGDDGRGGQEHPRQEPPGTGTKPKIVDSAASGSRTVVVTEPDEVDAEHEPTLKLKLKKKETESRRVNWTEETVDNEGLGRKKSKCCCIYVKPKRFIPGEPVSSSEDESDSDDECGHCPGHKGSDYRQ